MRWIALILALTGGLTACATVTPYDDIKVGSFKGSVIVVWIGEGGSSGDGLFVYVPDPDDPLTFSRHSSKPIGSVIRPGIMYTDGGSIPPFAQSFNGFSPWGYAPAYMVHDWLFTARHCLIDGATNPEYQQLRNVTFSDSAEILGEAIRTLVAEKKVKKDDFAGSTITGAVASFVARELWDAKGACKKNQVTERHVRLALDAINVPAPMTLLRQNESARQQRMASFRRSLATQDVVPKRKDRSRVVSRVSF
ncbi:MAG: hypothetical protein ACRCWF_10860 [Beijerinckiaceae bacterium]